MDKGIEFSFKAIFVTIAGAILLMIFVNFAFQQSGLFEKYSERAIMNSLENQLDAFSVSTSSNKAIELPEDTELRFSCNTLIVEDYSTDLEKVVFAPSSVMSNKLNAVTRTWKFPFKITNFFYLVDNENLHILIYDGESKDYVENLEVPGIKLLKMKVADFNVEKMRAQIKNRANIILFTQQINQQELMKIERANIVRVKLDDKEAVFYNGNKNYFFLDDETLLGIIVSPENYDCVMDKAFEKFNYVTAIHSQKAGLLTLKVQNSCKSFLAEAKNTLDVFKNMKNQDGLLTFKEKLEEQNSNLIRNDCQTIY